MTLIAQTINKGHPILIGDLLLSSNRPSDELLLPSYVSIPKINGIINANFPQNIKQKTYIISDNLAISLGGVISEMRTFLEDIKGEFKYKSCTRANFESFWSNYGFEEISQCTIGAVLIEKRLGNETLMLFYHKKENEWEQVDSHSYEKIFAWGSGAKMFIQATQQISLYSTNFINLDQTIYKHLSLIGQLLLMERNNAQNLFDAWGGGFEVVFYDGIRFNKLDDIVYIFLTGQIDARYETCKLTPTHIIKQKYIDNLLLFYTGENLGLTKRDCLAVSSLDVDHIDEQSIPLNNIEFKAKYYCYLCTLLVPDLSDKYIPLIISESHSKNNSVMINSNDHLEILISIEFEKQILDMVKKIR